MGIRWDGAERRQGERRHAMHEDHGCWACEHSESDHANKYCLVSECNCAGFVHVTESEARALDGNR